MITYYREYKDSSKLTPTGNAFCVFSGYPLPTTDVGLNHQQLDHVFNGVGTKEDKPNGAPSIIECSLVYLLVRCKPCTEAEARAIHPAIFGLLEIAQRNPMFSK